jgi:DNA-binding Lrp family transcriptional regulator
MKQPKVNVPRATIMPANITNEFRVLESVNLILTALENLKPMRYKEIEERTGVSSRTLSKHLRDLVTRGLIDKRDRRYCITSIGLQYLPRLADQLGNFRQCKMTLASLGGKRLMRHTAVEVTRITPSETCVGIVHVSVPRRVESSERYKMDRALTNALYTIADSLSLPKDFKEFTITITGARRT